LPSTEPIWGPKTEILPAQTTLAWITHG
jgi:hypothetical protein